MPYSVTKYSKTNQNRYKPTFGDPAQFFFAHRDGISPWW